jgi:hypothetical protein
MMIRIGEPEREPPHARSDEAAAETVSGGPLVGTESIVAQIEANEQIHLAARSGPAERENVSGF